MKDVQQTSAGWVDLYAAASITKGAALLIQNKAMRLLIVREQAAMPSESDVGGRLVPYLEDVQVDAGSPGLWLRSQDDLTIHVNVQEV